MPQACCRAHQLFVVEPQPLSTALSIWIELFEPGLSGMGWYADGWPLALDLLLFPGRLHPKVMSTAPICAVAFPRQPGCGRG